MLQLQIVNFRKDSYLFVEGKEQSDRFYIIQSGKVCCVKSNDKNGLATKQLGPGDFVGVIPCMSGHSQIENAITIEDTKCISVKKDQYPELIRNNTPIALKIIRTFAKRMREMNEQLTTLALNNVASETPEHMFEVADYYDNQGNRDIATYAYYQYLKECPKGEHFEEAKARFVAYKPTSKATYFEPTADLNRAYKEGTMIFSECQKGSDMFVIQDGQVTISKVVDGTEVVLAVLNRGDMFGEMALLENKPRSASAIAHTDCHLMVINRQNFDKMVGTQPQLIGRLTTTLAERLWSMYRQLDNACLTEPYHKVIDMLALQLEKGKKVAGPYQSDLTPKDLVGMCTIPANQEASVLYQLSTDKTLKIIGGKIYIPDCLEILKQAAFFRKSK